MQEKIIYSDIMALEFNEDYQDDLIYFEEFGYDYVIITKKLTDNIFIDWAKETQFAQLIRHDTDHTIKKQYPVKNLKELKEIINFFTDDILY